jgi:hypothetical protein
MSFSSTAQKGANTADATKNETLSKSLSTLALEGSSDDVDPQFKQRTFDVFWVEKKALMYREGISKVCAHIFEG